LRISLRCPLYDAITYHGGAKNVEITKKLIHAARNAHGIYTESLKKKKEEQNLESHSKAIKRKATETIKELARKRRMILEDARHQIEELDSQMNKLGSA